MRAAVAASPGPAGDVVSMRDVPEPAAPGSGEVTVRMCATTVNPSDLITISGAYSRTAFPFVPGFEGVGVIVAAGRDVPPGAVGQRVLPIGSAGAWQEIKRTADEWCVRLPDDIADETACFAYINPLTAVQMVDRFVGPEVGRVVVTAATSTIAGHLAQLLALRGLVPIGLTRSTPGRDVAEPALWAAVLSTSQPDWPARLRQCTGPSGADVVFDSVGGPGGLALMDALRPGGTFVHYGLLSGVPLPPECWRRNVNVELFRLRDVVHGTPRTRLDRLFQPVFDHLRAGRLLTAISGRHPFHALPDLLGREAVGLGKPLVTLSP